MCSGYIEREIQPCLFSTALASFNKGAEPISCFISLFKDAGVAAVVVVVVVVVVATVAGVVVATVVCVVVVVVGVVITGVVAVVVVAVVGATSGRNSLVLTLRTYEI